MLIRPYERKIALSYAKKVGIGCVRIDMLHQSSGPVWIRAPTAAEAKCTD